MRACVCPECSTSYEVPEALIGEEVMCPACRGYVYAKAAPGGTAPARTSEGTPMHRKEAEPAKPIGWLGKVLFGCAVVAFTVGPIILIEGCKSRTRERRLAVQSAEAANLDNDASMAWIKAKAFVEADLKSPSSAKFPWYSPDFVSSEGGGRYRVRAYVDAKNSFNATIRTKFTATLVQNTGGEWRLENLSLNE